ncbi:hypothetical protein BD626DRAFT_448958, partial [Schizophyllum amplum]
MTTPRHAGRTSENDGAERCPSALPIDIVNFATLSIIDSPEAEPQPAGALAARPLSP